MSDPLLVDVYEDDLNGKPNWPALVAAGPPWHGAILKATEGLHYSPPWFAAQWQALRVAAGVRLGVDFFIGAYHYLRFNLGGAAQAAYFLDAVRAAGGLSTLLPIVDVERANNANCTVQDVIRSTTDFAAEIKRQTGKDTIFYGGSLIADLGIADRMGCAWLWIARYAPTLPPVIYERIGWDASALAGWQYCGDGESYLAGYPSVAPIGKCDISAVVANGGGDAAIAWMGGA